MNKLEGVDPNRIKICGRNSENISEIRMNCYLFKDSLSHLSQSLDSLSKKHFRNQKIFDILKKHDICKDHDGKFNENKYKILCQGKSPFPYSYVTSFDVLFEKQLPSQGDFFNDLKNEPLSNEDYECANHIWKTFECKTLGDYLSIYLKLDVLLLADVMLDYSNRCGKNFCLYPEHFRLVYIFIY